MMHFKKKSLLLLILLLFQHSLSIGQVVSCFLIFGIVDQRLFKCLGGLGIVFFIEVGVPDIMPSTRFDIRVV